jgi:integrase
MPKRETADRPDRAGSELTDIRFAILAALQKGSRVGPELRKMLGPEIRQDTFYDALERMQLLDWLKITRESASVGRDDTPGRKRPLFLSRFELRPKGRLFLRRAITFFRFWSDGASVDGLAAEARERAAISATKSLGDRERGPERAASDDEHAALLSAAASDEERLFLRATRAGLRVNEIAATRFMDWVPGGELPIVGEGGQKASEIREILDEAAALPIHAIVFRSRAGKRYADTTESMEWMRAVRGCATKETEIREWRGPRLPLGMTENAVLKCCGPELRCFRRALKHRPKGVTKPEIRDLEWSDVDIQKRLIYIRRPDGPLTFACGDTFVAMLEDALERRKNAPLIPTPFGRRWAAYRFAAPRKRSGVSARVKLRPRMRSGKIKPAERVSIQQNALGSFNEQKQAKAGADRARCLEIAKTCPKNATLRAIALAVSRKTGINENTARKHLKGFQTGSAGSHVRKIQ